MSAEALRRLKDAGMEEAMLGVDADNPTGALGLYEGLGFEVDDRVEIFGWPAED
jgi:mycothiol synthase